MNTLINRYFVGTKPVSVQGDVWTQRVSGISSGLSDIEWSGSIFVAVGDTGKILTSEDGITWSPQTSGTTVRINSIIWNSSKFIAVGNNGLILTSTNGIDWASVAGGVSLDLLTISEANGKLFIGANTTNQPYRVLKSDDGGSSWSPTYSTSNTGNLVGYFEKVLWDGSKYIGYGYTGGFSGFTASFNTDVFISTDGASWGNYVTQPNSIFAIVYYNGIYVAASNTIQISTNGIDFSTVSGISTNVTALILTNTNRLLAPSSATTIMHYSDDGTTWLSKSIPGMGTTALASNGSLIVSVGAAGKIFTT